MLEDLQFTLCQHQVCTQQLWNTGATVNKLFLSSVRKYEIEKITLNNCD